MAKQFAVIASKKQIEENKEIPKEKAEQFIGEPEKAGTIFLPASQWKALKLKAVTENTTIKALVKEAIELLFKQ